MFNCCELEDSLPGSIVQQRKLSMLAEFTCESFNRTVLPFTLEAKGTEACYLAKYLISVRPLLCEEKQLYEHLFGGTEILL